MNKIVYFSLMLIMLSCAKEPKQVNFQLFEKSGVEIQGDGKLFTFSGQNAELSKEGQLLSFDRTQGEFQVIDLSSAKLLKRIKLELDGPNGISSPVFSSMLFQNQLLISTAKSLVVLDSLGTKSNEFLYSDLVDRFNLQNKSISVLIRSNWDKKTGDVYLWIKDFNSHQNQFKSYDQAIHFLKFNPISNQGEVIELKVPEALIQEGLGYYSALPPHVAVDNETLVYTFSYLPEIFVFDTKTKTSQQFEIPLNSYAQAEPIPYSKYRDASIGKEGAASIFVDLVYDSESKVIIRKGRHYFDGKMKGFDYLSIVDEEGNFDEVELGFTSGRLFFHDGYLYGHSVSNENEDLLAFDKLLITKVK